MDFIFFIKKLVGSVFDPLVLSIFLLLYGCYLLIANKSLAKAKFAMYSGTLVLVIFSSPVITNFLLLPIEESYPVYKDVEMPVDNILVLGCFSREDASRPILDNVHDCSMSRLIEALRLSYVYPNANVVLSGGGLNPKHELTHAEYSKQALLALGLEQEKIIVVNGSKDTEQEVENLYDHLVNKKNLLVTNASHMRRAVKLFNAKSIQVTPVPARYLTSDMELSIHTLMPSSEALKIGQRFFYEILGNLWVDIKLMLQME